MSDHMLEWLGAYLDGELRNGQLRKVQAHLETCKSCMLAFQDLQAVKDALHEVPAPAFPAPERLAAEVALRLPRAQIKPMRQRTLEIGWWLAPVALLLALIFIHTTFLVSEMVTTAADFGLLNQVEARLISGGTDVAPYTAVLGRFGLLDQGGLQWVTFSESLTRTTAEGLFWQISISLLYLSWMAIWWARHTLQEPGQPLWSGS